MNASRNLSCAIAAILGGSIASAASEEPADSTYPQIQEILVTAQRRTQSIQDVPITLQVFTAEALQELNVATFDDYVRYLPNVSASSNGPSQSDVFMRGLSAGVQQMQGSGSTGLLPNVAIYLDDQSGQLPNHNLDIYAADLERIEVLEGPQGTLFGSGAQAGAVRYITNKPKINVTEGNFEGGYGVTAHGDSNATLTAVLNVPLLADTLAVRAVIYNDSRGGYIDNVPGTFTRQPTDFGIHYANYPGGGVPPGSPALDNTGLAHRAINPVTYKGTRVEALYEINADWNVLLSQMYQNVEGTGVFYQMPKSSDGVPLAPLEVTLFNSAYQKDRFSNTAWTVNGKLGPLRAVYTGGFLVRHLDQSSDYTNYARGHYADYYQCYGPGTGGDKTLAPTCFSPSATWNVKTRNEHLQHEFRLTTPDEWRVRGIFGAYYETNKIFDQSPYLYKNIPACTSNTAPGTPGNTGCLSDIGPLPGTSVESPGTQNDHIAFINDTRRTTKQTAFYVSIDYDLIPKVLTATLGTRHFRFDNSLLGAATSSFGCFEQGRPAGGCANPATSYNLDAQHLSDTESGFKSRGNLTWHVTTDAMVYYTYSQGFRPGGFNQSGGALHVPGPDGVNQFVTPRLLTSDSLTNNEIGWKTAFLNRRLQWNGAIYREKWDNVQVAFFDPGLIGNILFNTNGQNFTVRGFETSIVARVTDALTLQAASSWNHSEQTNSPALIDGNPASVNFGKPITVACDSSGANCAGITNPFGPIGAPTANSPPNQFSTVARYAWAVGKFDAFAQFGAIHTGHSFTQSGSNPALTAGSVIGTTKLRFENPAYTSFDASFGVAKDAWSAHLYAQNLTNKNVSVFTNTNQFVVAQTVLRPRVIGVKLGYKF